MTAGGDWNHVGQVLTSPRANESTDSFELSVATSLFVIRTLLTRLVGFSALQIVYVYIIMKVGDVLDVDRRF